MILYYSISDMDARRCLPFLVVLGAALCGAVAPVAAAAEVAVLTTRAAAGNARTKVRWNPKTGLVVALSAADGRQSVRVMLRPKGGRVTVGGDKEVLPQAAVYGDRLPPLPDRETELLVKFRRHAWRVYLRNRLVASLPPPFVPPVTVAVDERDLLPTKARFQKVAPLKFHADFMIDANTKEPLAAWEAVSGEWGLHTVLEEAIAKKSPGRISQQPLQPERSPNFYSLRGKGVGKLPGMFITGYGFEDNYQLQASMQTGPADVGLVFYFQNPTNYYTFGLQRLAPDATRGVLTLERRTSYRLPRKEVLAAVTIPLTPGQWIMPRVRAWGNRIECFVDGVRIIDIEEELPPGGRYGVYVVSDEPRQFDDISLESVAEVDLRTLGDIRFHTIAADGVFYPKPSFWDYMRGKVKNPPASTVLQPPLGDKDKWLAIGAATDKPHVFGFEVTPISNFFRTGILIGFRSADKPYYRYRYAMDGDFEEFVLERVRNEKATVLAKHRQRYLGRDRKPVVRLAADATSRSVLRLHRNGELVLLHEADDDDLTGASGVWVGANTRVKLSGFEYLLHPRPAYRNHFEKNQIFLTDPFMRHWSSPEGEWVTDPKTEMVWHKSDFFDRYAIHLPLVNGAAVHLGVEEGRTRGTVIVKTLLSPSLGDGDDGPEVKVQLLDGAKPDRVLADGQVPAGVLDQEGVLTGSKTAFSVHYEDNWLWVLGGDDLILKHHLPRPFKGTRVRISGYSTEHLKHSFVFRYGVKDFLFKEAQHHWVTNGGDWSITNRFQCQPRWSHLNGQSKETIAAMWSKYVFEGDFCAEFYAGMRHGWYKRVGDLNLTVMNRSDTPGSGYTVTCTGWDFNHSQLLTRLYRDGKVVVETDEYALPRLRAGNRRKLRHEILSGGRDVHGAWYYIKLRRIGKRLEYYLDNELLFAWEDDKPIDLGSMGVWTYRNSMVVARVKIAADEIRPKPVPAKPYYPPPEPQTADKNRINADEVLVDTGLAPDMPAVCLQPRYWAAKDPVSHLQLDWHRELSGTPYFVATNVLGNGTALVAGELPPLPVNKVAGFRFLVKNTNLAKYNFHFAVGRLVDDEFQAKANYFYRINGTDFSRGDVRSAGRLQAKIKTVPAGREWHRKASWTPVSVWLPIAETAALAAAGDNLVKVIGFGNLQPSYVQQGLRGNGPDEAYAVRDFTVVRYGLPQLARAAAKDRPLRFMAYDLTHNRTLGREASVAGIQQALADYDRQGLNRVRLRILPQRYAMSECELQWLHLPTKPDCSVTWSKDRPDAVVLTSPTRDRRLGQAQLLLAGKALPLTEPVPGERVAWLPRPLPTANGKVKLTLVIGAERRPLELKLADRPAPSGPALVRLEGLTPDLMNFEDRKLPASCSGNPHRLHHNDPVQGSYLEVRNTAYGQRLPLTISRPVQLARFPVLQFRYRAVPSAQVSIHLPPAHVSFGEPEAPGTSNVRHGDKMIADGEWHTWTGVVADADASRPVLSRGMLTSYLRFISLAPRDQTGRYSYLELDDICFGPALRGDRKLTFTPHYEDIDGSWTQDVYLLLRAGPKAYHELSNDEKHALRPDWKPVKNGKACNLDLSRLPAGVSHLMLRAVDKDGVESVVTDIPIFVDRKPLLATVSTVNPGTHIDNGVAARIAFADTHSAPLDTTELKLTFQGQRVVPNDAVSNHRRRGTTDILTVNWPYVLRQQLNSMKDGDRANLIISGIRSGSGIPGPEVKVPIKINYAADKRGPAFLAPSLPANVNLMFNWYGRQSASTYFAPASKNKVAVLRKIGAEPYLVTTGRKKAGIIHLRTKWNLEDFPFLAVQLQRPSKRDKSTMILQLATSAGSYQIPLANDPKTVNSRTLEPPRALKWQPGEWTPAVLNIRELIRNKGKKHRQIVISRISVIRSGIKGKAELHIKNLTIFAAWRPDNVVALNAYDASGIGKVSWEYVADGKVLKQGRQSSLKLAPAKLGLPLKPDGWLKVHIADRAGNSTPPFYLPVPKP